MGDLSSLQILFLADHGVTVPCYLISCGKINAYEKMREHSDIYSWQVAQKCLEQPRDSGQSFTPLIIPLNITSQDAIAEEGTTPAQAHPSVWCGSQKSCYTWAVSSYVSKTHRSHMPELWEDLLWLTVSRWFNDWRQNEMSVLTEGICAVFPGTKMWLGDL